MQQATLNGSNLESQLPYDPFTMPTTSQTVPTAQYNPYLTDNGDLSGSNTAFYPTQPTYTATAQPVSKVQSLIGDLLTK
jgi:PAB-dependent poly(A)-specific ribonuclease subunit 3